MQKLAQPVSELDKVVGEELHATSGGASVEEDVVEGLLELAAGAVEVPVSIGMSSKLAVHTGPTMYSL